MVTFGVVPLLLFDNVNPTWALFQFCFLGRIGYFWIVAFGVVFGADLEPTLASDAFPEYGLAWVRGMQFLDYVGRLKPFWTFLGTPQEDWLGL